MRPTTFFPIIGALALLVCCALPTRAADAFADVNAFDALFKKMGPLKDKDPKSAITEWTRFLEQKPDMDPWAAVAVCSELADLYQVTRNTKPALDLCDAQLQKYDKHPAVIATVATKAGVLNSDGHPADAEKLIDKYWDLYPETFRNHANAMLFQYCKALEEQDKMDLLLKVLPSRLSGYPSLVDEALQYPVGWIYDRLVRRMVAQNEYETAAAWAKLRFVTCRFDTAAIERSTRTLVAVWIAKDPSQRGVKAFADCQTDPTKPNPLAAVAVPAFDAESLKRSGRAYGGNDDSRVHDKVTLLLVTGALREAMIEARQHMIEKPESTVGVQEVCRVLKASDCNVKRANAFIDFIKSGSGANPLDDFFKERPAKPPVQGG